MRLEAKADVATLWLDRPPANAIDLDALVALEAALDRLAAGPAHVLLVRARGRFFCAGADIGMLAAGSADAAGIDAMVAFAGRLQAAYRRLAALPVVSIAVLQGIATGGGLELGLACDLRIGSEEARYGLPEVKLGLLAAAGGTQGLTRAVGPSVASRLLLTGELVDGAEALRIGLVQYLRPADAIDAFAETLAAEIAALPAASLAANKRCIAAAGTPDGYAVELQESRRLHHEPDTKRRLDAFVAARSGKR